MWYRIAKEQDPTSPFDVEGATPEQILEMEKRNYPEPLQTLNESFDPYEPIEVQGREYLREEGLSRIISRGDYPYWYYILEVKDNKKKVGLEDLSILDTRYAPQCLRSLISELKKLNGYTFTAALRENTSWPLLLRVLNSRDIIIPIEKSPTTKSPVKKVIRDETGRITGLKTETYEWGGETFHEFKGRINFD